MLPKVNIHRVRSDMLLLAARTAHKFMKEFPERKPGVHNLVAYAYEGDIMFSVWRTKAGNVTVYGVDGTK